MLLRNKHTDRRCAWERKYTIKIRGCLMIIPYGAKGAEFGCDANGFKGLPVTLLAAGACALVLLFPS